VTQVALACDVVWILTVDGHAYCKPLERVDDAKPWFSGEHGWCAASVLLLC